MTTATDSGIDPHLDLPNVLESVASTARFATSGVMLGALPALSVRGVGRVALPLRDLSALAGVAEAAPFGRGRDTVYDARVRSCLQVDGAAVEVVGRRFEVALAEAVKTATAALGVEGREVRAELYKLLVYGPGDHFAAHRDSEKVDGMFGTLVVTLPGEWTGGDLVVSHSGAQKRFDGRAEEAADVAWAAFYADCVHQIEPLVSGARVALTYNLVGEAGTSSTPMGLEPEVAEARRVLRAFAALGEPKLVMPLEHDYTRAGLTFEGLKGADAGRAAVLAEAARREGFDLHLGLVAIRESGSAEPIDWERGYGRRYTPVGFAPSETHDRSVILEAMIPAPGQGFRACGGLAVEDHELSPPGALDDAPKDSIRFTESTGNEGASFERSYRRASFVLSPISARGALLAALPHANAVATACSLYTAGERSLTEGLVDALIGAWPEFPRWRWGGVDNDDWDDADEDGDTGNAIAATSAGDSGHEIPNASLQSRFLAVLVLLGDPDRVRRFLSTFRTTTHWLGDTESAKESGRVLGCASIVLGAAATEHLHRILTAVVAQSEPLGAALAEGLVETAPALSGFAGRVLLDEVIRLALTPGAPSPWRVQEYGRDDSESRPESSSRLGSILRVLADLAPDACRSTLPALARPATGSPYSFDRDVVPALVEVLKCSKRQEELAALGPLATAVNAVLEARIASPLSPPADERRELTLQCRCDDCRSVAAFMASPTERVWQLRANEASRRHVQSTVSGADVKAETLRVGSPHTLRLQKTTASYDRRVADRKRDIAAAGAIGRFLG